MNKPKPWTFDSLVDWATTYFIEQVLGGHTSLRSAIYTICFSAQQWGRTEAKEEIRKLQKKR